MLGGLTDNWIYLGAHLRVDGVLGEGDRPLVLRAPGYPLFVAGILALGTERPSRVSFDYLVFGAGVVYAAQAVLLALSGMLLFLWLSEFVPRVSAFAAGLLLATSPHAVVLVGLAHYSVLHIFLLVAGGLALDRLLSRDDPSPEALLGSGLLWGAATLVRSTTLILPPFVLLLFLVKTRVLRRSLHATLWFGAGMCLAIAPVTIRNYRVANRLVPVNHQAGAALWGSTVKPLRADPNSYRWYSLFPEFMTIFTRVTGERDYDYGAYARHHIRLDDAMRSEAVANLVRDPRPYLQNALGTLKTLCLDTSSILVRSFQHSQPPRPWVDRSWFAETVRKDFLPAVPAVAYVRLGSVLTALAGIGLGVAIFKREAPALVPVVVFCCLAMAHAVTYMDLLYYYVRLPFVAFLAFYGLHALSGAVRVELRPLATRVGALLALSLSGASLTLTLLLLTR